MVIAGISRRTFLAGAAGMLMAHAGLAHTPYRQWDVYRRKHLLIGTCRADPKSYPLGKRLAGILASDLRDSKARVTRAPDQLRLASLITTEQLDLVLLTFAEAVALAGGKAPFAEFEPYPLRLVFEVDEHALVCGEKFPDRHAWVVTRALAEQLPVSERLVAPGELGLAVNDGSRAFLTGQPQPD